LGFTVKCLVPPPLESWRPAFARFGVDCFLFYPMGMTPCSVKREGFPFHRLLRLAEGLNPLYTWAFPCCPLKYLNRKQLGWLWIFAVRSSLGSLFSCPSLVSPDKNGLAIWQCRSDNSLFFSPSIPQIYSPHFVHAFSDLGFWPFLFSCGPFFLLSDGTS